MPGEHPAAQLGEILVARGKLSRDQLQIALHEQRRQHRLLGKLLVALGFTSETDICLALGEMQGRSGIDLRQASIDPSALKIVPLELARQHKLFPIDFNRQTRRLRLAVSDPSDIVGLDKIRALVSDDVEIDALLAGESEIEQAIDQHYDQDLSIDGILAEIECPTNPALRSASTDPITAPIIRLVDSFLSDAIKRSASDIHFEPEAHSLSIRYRIDGLLRRIRVLHLSLWPAMTVRLKVMAGMDIAEMRTPQDGRISLTISGRPVDLRVSSQPTLHGENIVLRILDRSKGIVPLDALGLASGQLDLLSSMLERPEGMLLLCGPTGSGKTSTLYSILQHIEREEINIMTLEDPVEYPMARVRQSTVSETTKLGFADGIRAMLRQDPDAILIGEIRDAETAEMAFRAALTGHQVFSTLHAGSALGVMPRLADLGIRTELIAGNLIGVVAQRLVRRLCTTCRQAHATSEDEAKLFQHHGIAPPPILYRPGQCTACEGLGYRGRQAIMEILRFDPQLDDLLLAAASQRQMLEYAAQNGFIPLAADGLKQAARGITSLAEIRRVVVLSDGR